MHEGTVRGFIPFQQSSVLVPVVAKGVPELAGKVGFCFKSLFRPGYPLVDCSYDLGVHDMSRFSLGFEDLVDCIAVRMPVVVDDSKYQGEIGIILKADSTTGCLVSFPNRKRVMVSCSSVSVHQLISADKVVIQGLKDRTSLNGILGVVNSSFDTERCRYCVSFEQQGKPTTMWVQRQNLYDESQMKWPAFWDVSGVLVEKALASELKPDPEPDPEPVRVPEPTAASGLALEQDFCEFSVTPSTLLNEVKVTLPRGDLIEMKSSHLNKLHGKFSTCWFLYMAGIERAFSSFLTWGVVSEKAEGSLFETFCGQLLFSSEYSGSKFSCSEFMRFPFLSCVFDEGNVQNDLKVMVLEQFIKKQSISSEEPLLQIVPLFLYLLRQGVLSKSQGSPEDVTYMAFKAWVACAASSVSPIALPNMLQTSFSDFVNWFGNLDDQVRGEVNALFQCLFDFFEDKNVKFKFVEDRSSLSGVELTIPSDVGDLFRTLDTVRDKNRRLDIYKNLMDSDKITARQLQETIQELQQEIKVEKEARLKADADAKSEASRLAREIRKAHLKVEAEFNARQQLDRRVALLNEKEEKLQIEIERIKQSKKDKVESLQNKIESIMQSKKDKEEKLNRDVEKVRKEIEDIKQSKDSIETRSNSIVTEFQLKRKVMEDRVAGLTKQLSEIDEKLKVTEGQNEELRKNLDIALGEASTNKEIVAKVSDEKADLVAKIKVLKRKLEEADRKLGAAREGYLQHAPPVMSHMVPVAGPSIGQYQVPEGWDSSSVQYSQSPTAGPINIPPSQPTWFFLTQ